MEEKERQERGHDDQGHIEPDLDFAEFHAGYSGHGVDDAFARNFDDIRSNFNADAYGEDRAANKQA